MLYIDKIRQNTPKSIDAMKKQADKRRCKETTILTRRQTLRLIDATQTTKTKQMGLEIQRSLCHQATTNSRFLRDRSKSYPTEQQNSHISFEATN
jgi:hypothetical protein